VFLHLKRNISQKTVLLSKQKASRRVSLGNHDQKIRAQLEFFSLDNLLVSFGQKRTISQCALAIGGDRRGPRKNTEVG